MPRRRWQPVAVAAALAAPPVMLTVLVWPSGAAPAPPREDRVEASLGPGDAIDGNVSGTFSADYEIVGAGDRLRVAVAGDGGLDTTLTLVDPDTGEQLDFVDDTDGLDPALAVDLDDGDTVIAEVRSLSGRPGSFTISVTAG